MSAQNKAYLGDGVYAEFDAKSNEIVLTTDSGRALSNTIYLEPEVVDALLKYIELARTVYKKSES